MRHLMTEAFSGGGAVAAFRPTAVCPSAAMGTWFGCEIQSKVSIMASLNPLELAEYESDTARSYLSVNPAVSCVAENTTLLY